MRFGLFTALLILAGHTAQADEVKQFAQCAGVGDAVVEFYAGDAPGEDMDVIANEAYIFFALARDAADDEDQAKLHLDRASARTEVLRLLNADVGDAVHVPIQYCGDLRQQLGQEERFELP